MTGSHGPPIWFSAVWIAGVCFMGYLWIVRVTYKLMLERSRVTAYGMIRRAEFDVSQIVEIVPTTFTPQFATIRVREGRDVLIVNRSGFSRIVDDMLALNPSISVNREMFDRLSTRGWRASSTYLRLSDPSDRWARPPGKADDTDRTRPSG